MQLKDIAVSYFRRRTLLRILLIVVIGSLWVYSEVSDFQMPPERALNYQAIQEIETRYQGGTFSYAVVGDSKNSPVFDDVIRRINQDDSIDFVIMGGDLVLYPTVETYRSFLAQRAELHAPSVVLPGNHDVAFKNHYFYHLIFGRFYRSFVVGDSQFILLDDSNEERIDADQLDWLKQQLEAGQSYKNRFVFMHVPMWDPRGTNELGVRFAHSLGDTDAARRLEDLFRQQKVTLLFESHIHGYYDIPEQGLHQVITGGGGAALSGSDPQHAFFHYIKVTVSDTTVSTQLVALEKQKSTKVLAQYLTNAKLYLLTFLKLYKLQFILGLFLVLLFTDVILEYLYQRNSSDSAK